MITQIASGKRRIKLGAVHPTRDFTHVSDTVAAFLAALESSRNIGEVVQIGSDFEISIADTARTIAELMGATIEIQTDGQRVRPEASEVERLWASTAKANDLLGWHPKFGGKDGFRRATSIPPR